MKMKWNEAVFRALGEIDDDLIPPDEPARKAEDKTEDRESEKPARRPKRKYWMMCTPERMDLTESTFRNILRRTFCRNLGVWKRK